MVYFNSDAEGGLWSFDSYGIELNYAKRIGRHGFVVTLDANDRQYDEANPIYGKTREERVWCLFSAYEFADCWVTKIGLLLRYWSKNH
ncbi:DUF2860 domain-containing protein [Vibrio chagasii]|nr:DUF2860 domain-containing protein [Vibrio chagasii]